MKLNLVVDIDDLYLDQYMAENPSSNWEQLKGEINNACYLGLDCTNAIIMRQMGFGVSDTYVKKPFIVDGSWGQVWGDNFPTENDCPANLIAHHAQANNIQLTNEMISFAKAMWNEGNLAEKLS